MAEDSFNNRPIGVFDSGLGGLTAVKALESLLPNESIIYFGDTSRVPYGTKSQTIVQKYTGQIISFLKSHNVKAILAACGTVSSVAGSVGQDSGLPFSDVLHATAAAAAAATKNGRIGVIGTPTTIASGSYSMEIRRINADIQVFEQACPMFVPLVENGYLSPEDPVSLLIARQYLIPLRDMGIDTLVLGCTHYPIISKTIAKVVGPEIKLINSGKEAARELSENLRSAGLLKGDASRAEYSFFVSDTVEHFLGIAETFLGHSLQGKTSHIDIEEY